VVTKTTKRSRRRKKNPGSAGAEVALPTWSLSFSHPSSITLRDLEQLAGAVVGAPVAFTIGELRGNPRDYYDRTVEGAGERDGVLVGFRTSQSLQSPDDPQPLISSLQVTLASTAALFAAKLALWKTVQDALGPLGFTEHTLTYGGAEVIDEAEATGDVATWTLLRERKAAKLIEHAAHAAHVVLISPRTDIEPVLAAHPRPAEVSSMSLSDCRIAALPPSFSRFTGLTMLSLEEDAIDGDVLRGIYLPKLEHLRIRGQAVRSLTSEDLAGFPALQLLSCTHCPLSQVDPAILDVCPRLVRIYLEHTPLWREHEAELRARWPNVAWSHGEGHTVASKPAVRPTATKAAPVFERKQSPPELRPFFAKILAAPDDDAPRLELAAYLTAHGDKRGQQIREACELATLAVDDPRYDALRNRTPRLPEFVFFSDTPYPFLGVYQVRRRGFVEHIECSGRDFVRYADVLLQDAPIRGLTLSTVDDAESVARCPALAALRELRLDRLSSTDRGGILRSPHLVGSLERVAVGSLTSAADVELLANQLRPLTRLTELELRSTLTAEAAPALIALVKARGLTRLRVDFCSMKPTRVAEDLWDQLGDVVRPHRVPRVPFEDGVLDLSDGKFSLEQLRAVFATGLYRSATRLSLSGARNGDGVVTLLATCGAFPNLVELSLGWVSDAGVAALATKAVGLERLESIFLGEIVDDRPCVSDAGVALLARSARLPALRKIERSQTHNVYAPGARDDAEVHELRREDGTIVRSIVGHTLWP